MIKNINTIFRREMQAYFNSPIAYIFIIVFLLISAGLFMSQFFLISSADMRAFFFILPLILCVFMPAVTMRLWSEERRGNTLELLLTFPMNTYELVLGKFLASGLFYIIALCSTLTVPFMLILSGNPDIGAMFSQYLGAVFSGGFFLALGLFVSGFCKDQIVSFILSISACFVLFFLGTDFTAGSIDNWIQGLGSFLRKAVAIGPHFATFQKGVIDVRDVLYFILGTGIFLTLNAFWLESRLRPKTKSFFTTASFMSFGIFILMNFILSDTTIGRFDCTKGRIYTISKASREILQELKAPVTVKLFISPEEKMPSGMKILERDVRDKLDEFKASSKGRFDYKVFHMESAAGREDEKQNLEKSIERKGIRPFQVQSVEADEVGVKLIYSSLSIAYKEKPEEIIPQVMPESLFNLEYAIISKLYRMTLEKTPSIALVAPYTEKEIDPKMRQVLAMFGQQGMEKIVEDDYELVSKVLEYEGYELSRIRLTEDEQVPQGIDTLIVLGPEKLNDRQRFEINRFLVNGGSVFLAVQNYDFNFRPVGMNGFGVSAVPKDSEINRLIEKWGLGVNKDFLMDTEVETLSLSTPDAGIFSVSQPVKMPMQIKIIPDQMNKDVSITSYVPTLFYLWGSALDVDSGKLEKFKLTAETLFTASPEAWIVSYHSGTLASSELVPFPKAEHEAYPLAVFVTGRFPDAFEGEDVPIWPKTEEAIEENEAGSVPVAHEEKKLNSKPGKLILIGCAQMFNKNLFDKGGHVRFFLNSIDALTLGEKLIGVRSKAPIDRTLKKMSAITKTWWRIFTMVLVPVILCTLGAVRIFLRKRSKAMYLKAIEGV